MLEANHTSLALVLILMEIVLRRWTVKQKVMSALTRGAQPLQPAPQGHSAHGLIRLFWCRLRIERIGAEGTGRDSSASQCSTRHILRSIYSGIGRSRSSRAWRTEDQMVLLEATTEAAGVRHVFKASYFALGMKDYSEILVLLFLALFTCFCSLRSMFPWIRKSHSNFFPFTCNKISKKKWEQMEVSRFGIQNCCIHSHLSPAGIWPMPQSQGTQELLALHLACLVLRMPLAPPPSVSQLRAIRLCTLHPASWAPWGKLYACLSTWGLVEFPPGSIALIPLGSGNKRTQRFPQFKCIYILLQWTQSSLLMGGDH